MLKIDVFLRHFVVVVSIVAVSYIINRLISEFICSIWPPRQKAKRGFFMRQIANAELDLDITNGLEARL